MSLISRLKKETLLFWIFSLLAIAAPIGALFPMLTPTGEAPAIWFQRSGAMTVTFALLAEIFAIRFQKALFPKSAFGNTEAEKARPIYRKRPAIMNSSAFLLIASGTLIWGYGDLMYNNWFKPLAGTG